jgi:hypothetical protein
MYLFIIPQKQQKSKDFFLAIPNFFRFLSLPKVANSGGRHRADHHPAETAKRAGKHLRICFPCGIIPTLTVTERQRVRKALILQGFSTLCGFLEL